MEHFCGISYATIAGKMSAHIEISRPLSLLMIVGVAFFGLSHMMGTTQTAQVLDGQGGEDLQQIAIHTAEDEMRRSRIESKIAERHIEILKFQLRVLEEERKRMGPDLDPELNEEFRAGLRLIVELIEGKRRADDKMVQSFKEMWDANRAGLAAATLSDEDPVITIQWPVEPTYGISAIFQDPEYKQYFGMEHNAIDIPALQGTPVVTADDGVVEEVVDNGLGYNFITVRHAGYVTLYGHLSEFHVQKGQQVLRGDPIGLSGGMPGTAGAGNLSTGPHLHFELITGGGHINALKHLPAAGVELRK